MGRVQENLCSKDGQKEEENEGDRKIKGYLKIDLEYLENHHIDHKRIMKKRREKHLGLKNYALKFKNVKSVGSGDITNHVETRKKRIVLSTMHLGNKFTER